MSQNSFKQLSETKLFVTEFHGNSPNMWLGLSVYLLYKETNKAAFTWNLILTYNLLSFFMLNTIFKLWNPFYKETMSFPGGPVAKNLPTNAADTRNLGLIPGSRRSPGEGNGHALTPLCLPGKSQGQRNLVGSSPQVTESHTRHWEWTCKWNLLWSH